MKEKQIVLQPDVKESGVRINLPEGCEVEKIETVDGFIAVTFKSKEPKLPRSWEEFCEMFPIKKGESYFSTYNLVAQYNSNYDSRAVEEKMTLPDCATAEAVLALCQLIQLRNCYNGDWAPNWKKGCDVFTIEFENANITSERRTWCAASPLFFKSKELRDEFQHNFSPLIEKLKPLYGIREEVE